MQNSKKSNLLEQYYWSDFDVTRNVFCEVEDNISFFYHYTSIDAFKSIIESKKMYATRYDCLNDENERKDVIKVLERVIEQYKDQNEKLYNCLKNCELKNINSYLNASYEETQYLFVRQFEKPQVFFISFCLKPDDWTMWNTYIKGDKKGGISFGFRVGNGRFFMDWESDSENGNCYSFRVFPVIYKNKNKERIIKKFFDEISEKYTGSQEDNKIVQEIINAIIVTYQDQFKDEHFKDEKEIRVAIVQEKDSPAYPVKYRASGSSLIPYIEFDYYKNFEIVLNQQLDRVQINGGAKNYLVESREERKIKWDIRLSPFSNTREDVLKEFLMANGFDLSKGRVKASEIPIRKN